VACCTECPCTWQLYPAESLQLTGHPVTDAANRHRIKGILVPALDYKRIWSTGGMITSI